MFPKSIGKLKEIIQQISQNHPWPTLFLKESSIETNAFEDL